jgi:hypothetical protein
MCCCRGGPLVVGVGDWEREREREGGGGGSQVDLVRLDLWAGLVQ